MTFDILQGDVLTRLADLPDGCVNMCVTSPPYFGLRNYGTGTWEGGDTGCQHVLGDDNCCTLCGAEYKDFQIGLESTPKAYIDSLVKVFREVRRVLRDDGVLWVNIGDSYAGSGKGRCADGSFRVTEGLGKITANSKGQIKGVLRNSNHIEGCKPKDLIGIPWMFAFAMREDGWYLRQDIIWAKPNPTPESVQDRCTRSHEYIFMFSKSRRYYFDHEAMQEIAVDGVSRRNKRDVWTVPVSKVKEAHFATYPEELVEPCILATSPMGGLVIDTFNGSGTTGIVAVKNGRNYIGFELNPEYVDVTDARVHRECPLMDITVDSPDLAEHIAQVAGCLADTQLKASEPSLCVEVSAHTFPTDIVAMVNEDK